MTREVRNVALGEAVMFDADLSTRSQRGYGALWGAIIGWVLGIAIGSIANRAGGLAQAAAGFLIAHVWMIAIPLGVIVGLLLGPSRHAGCTRFATATGAC